MSPENINEITQKLDAAKNDLHGEQKLEQDKQQATERINQMKSLNHAQKDELNHEIQQAQTRPDIVATVNKAKPLDTAMKKLRTVLLMLMILNKQAITSMKYQVFKMLMTML